MISFLDLKGLNAQYRAELIEACTKVIVVVGIFKEVNAKSLKKSLQSIVELNMLLVWQMVWMHLF